MAYCVISVSMLPQDFPMMKAIKEDGSDFHFTGLKRFPPLGQGVRLTEDTIPRSSSIFRFAVMTSKHKSLQDIFMLGDVICVSQTARDTIESLEPDIHQFFPVTIFRSKKGGAFDGSYYILNICQILDSMIIERSDFRFVTVSGSGNKPTYSYYTRPISGPKTTTLRRNIIAHAHLWREAKYVHEFYLSDLLYEKLRELKIKSIERGCVVKTQDI